jgi:hypothetical protein
MREYISSGTGTNTLSSSIPLDPEDDHACTLVVPGFHNHIQEWHQHYIIRGEDSAGTTTNCNTQYSSQDRADFGYPVARPCPAYGLTLTRPEIIHGSPPTSDPTRRVIYTWLTGILPDHLTLEKPGTPNWQEVAACHRDMEAPTRGVGGDTPKHSVPPFRFPASVTLLSSYPLGDALLGRRKWDDPEVLMERNILLGPDDARAKQYVDEKRQKLLAKYRKAFAKLDPIERAAFGENSYFHARDLKENGMTDS